MNAGPEEQPRAAKRKSHASIDLTGHEGSAEVSDTTFRGANQHQTQYQTTVEVKKEKAEKDHTPKVSASLVTQRVLSRLMTEGALSLSDLAKSIPDATKELIASILEILQVLGVVAHYRVNPAANSNSAVGANSSVIVVSSSSGGSSAPKFVYVMAGVTKGSEPLDLRNVIEQTAQKRQNVTLIEARCAALQALTSKALPRTERMAECRGLIVEAINRDNLHDDALFRTVAELCGHTFPTRSRPAAVATL